MAYKKRVSYRKKKRKYHYGYGYSKSTKYTDYAILLAASLLIIVITILIFKFITRSKSPLKINTDSVAAYNIPYSTFSSLEILSVKYNIDFYELLTYYAVENKFFASDINIADTSQIEQSFIMNYENIKNRYSHKEILPYYTMLSTIISEIQYFPIPLEYMDSDAYMYGNSWGAVRTYGKEKFHLGTDITDRDNIRGRIAVISMTDGIIEDIGWEEYGGYRIGIRTSKNTYYYYSHLDSFAEGITKSTTVKAGELLGFMGDSGYSKKEGTVGKAAVHLHIGISPDVTFTKDDFWINPYVFLRHIEEKNK